MKGKRLRGKSLNTLIGYKGQLSVAQALLVWKDLGTAQTQDGRSSMSSSALGALALRVVPPGTDGSADWSDVGVVTRASNDVSMIKSGKKRVGGR